MRSMATPAPPRSDAALVAARLASFRVRPTWRSSPSRRSCKWSWRTKESFAGAARRTAARRTARSRTWATTPSIKMARVLAALERIAREVAPRLPRHPLCGRPTLSVGTIARRPERQHGARPLHDRNRSPADARRKSADGLPASDRLSSPTQIGGRPGDRAREPFL